MLTLKQRQRRIRNALALVAVFSFCAPTLTGGTRPDEYVARAKQLIRRLYPDLDRLLQPIIVDGNRLRDPDSMGPDLMNLFTMELYDVEARRGGVAPTGWCSDPVFSAHFLFDWQTEKKELVDMTAGGPGATGRRDRFARDVTGHPDWSDAQVASALSDAGARYGPGHKAELLRALPLEELKPFVGGDLEVVSAEFFVREFGAETKTSKVSLSWIVRAKWRSSDGHEARYTLAFEPFEGRLEMIHRNASIQREPDSGAVQKAPHASAPASPPDR